MYSLIIHVHLPKSISKVQKQSLIDGVFERTKHHTPKNVLVLLNSTDYSESLVLYFQTRGFSVNVSYPSIERFGSLDCFRFFLFLADENYIVGKRSETFYDVIRLAGKTYTQL